MTIHWGIIGCGDVTEVKSLHGKGRCDSTGVSAARTSAVMDAVLLGYYGSRGDGFWRTPENWPGGRTSADMGPQPFKPVIAADSTKYRCAAKKSRTQGSMQTALPAKRSCASVMPNWPLKLSSARVSVLFSVVFK
jgi:hypothetical protein